LASRSGSSEQVAHIEVHRLVVFNFVVLDDHYPKQGDRFVLAASFKPLTRAEVESVCEAHPQRPAEVARLIGLNAAGMNWPPCAIIGQPIDVAYLAQILIVATAGAVPVGAASAPAVASNSGFGAAAAAAPSEAGKRACPRSEEDDSTKETSAAKKAKKKPSKKKE
jgi:hypothetical protein